jgi:hypothetical protein
MKKTIHQKVYISAMKEGSNGFGSIQPVFGGEMNQGGCIFQMEFAMQVVTVGLCGGSTDI